MACYTKTEELIMRDKFTITIHDVNGAKQYTLKQIDYIMIIYAFNPPHFSEEIQKRSFTK